MADLEEAVTTGIAANAFIVAEATADEFKRSFVQAIEFASLAMMRGRAEKRSRRCVDSDRRNIKEAVHMANDRRFGLWWMRVERVWNPDICARENSLGKSRGLRNVSGL